MEITLSSWKTQTHDEFLFELVASFNFPDDHLREEDAPNSFLDSDKYGP